jgi:hypothetical protein
VRRPHRVPDILFRGSSSLNLLLTIGRGLDRVTISRNFSQKMALVLARAQPCRKVSSG